MLDQSDPNKSLLNDILMPIMSDNKSHNLNQGDFIPARSDVTYFSLFLFKFKKQTKGQPGFKLFSQSEAGSKKRH